jgi:hypothetical protein
VLEARTLGEQGLGRVRIVPEPFAQGLVGQTVELTA